MKPSSVKPPQTQQDLAPSAIQTGFQADVIIVGVGIAGLLTAYELLQRGQRVLLIEQNQAGRAASWAGGGILSPMYPWRYPKAVNDLAQYGKAYYQKLNAVLQPQTQIDVEVHNTGLLIFDPEDVPVGLNFAEQHAQPMQRSELLQGAALHRLNPRLADHLQQALYFPEIANIRNPRLLQSLLRYIQQHPRAQLIEQQAVERLLIQAGQIQGVVCANGRYTADRVVICSGAWSAAWQQQLGLRIPVNPVHGQMLLIKTPAAWLPTMCMHKVMYLIPRVDGHVVCGSTMNHYDFDTSTKAALREQIYQAAVEMVPDLAQFPVVQQWAGLRPSSPHGVPYIGECPNVKNLWFNVGHFRNGLCMGPASAQLLVQLMQLETPLLDPTPFSPSCLKKLDEVAAF